ncbi:MAG: family 16 glycosylhydrolase [Paracoccaceae bacterium]|nr:family 16 glycosylhydrolase [Paracoccaceae bacterium]MDH5529574.1 family 16 glycosylhydrolase [Paracoccaceae bacterium]
MVCLTFQKIMVCSLVLTCAAPSYAGPDLSKFTPVLIEEFNSPFSRFDGRSGVWKDFPRRERYVGNGPPSLYVNPSMLRQDGSPLGLDPFKVENGQLSISAAPIPADDLADVRSLLKRAGYSAEAVKQVRYFTGMLSTRASWAQTYGYFEMRARLPEGRGHWPAFWLTPAVNGWPPEIDIFEVLGRENGVGTSKAVDNRIHLRVHFDEIAADGTHTPEPTLLNPFDLMDGAPKAAIRRERQIGPRYTFAKSVDVGQEFGRDIFDEFNVYGLSWTPEEIIWWFGPSGNELTEIYRSPTPRDVNGPMSVIINDQIGGSWAGDPDPALDSETFSQDFAVDYVKIYALTPQNRVTSDQVQLQGGPTDDVLIGSAKSQTFYPKAGFDILTGGGGADRFVIAGGKGSKLLTDFQPDDVVVMEQWSFNTADKALDRLDQVGQDVWLIDTRQPEASQTIIFQNLLVTDLSAENFEFGGGG